MKAIALAFLFLSVETSCKNNTILPLKKAADATIPSVTFRALSPEEITRYTQQATERYSRIIHNKSFNGSVLVAKNGQVLLESYQGYADFGNRRSIDAATVFHLASVSKTFTGMAILKMWENRQLGLDDDIRLYIPQFPYAGITIRLLLCHRSGLPNYAYVMPDINNYLYTNQDVVNYLIHKKPALTRPVNTGFEYCNTNFVLLAAVIEKISGQDYPSYMKQTVFDPLGMTHTYVCSKDNIHLVPASYTTANRPYRVECFDAIYGDKNIYSNVRDLLTWDNALYSGLFVNPVTTAMAYQPTSNEKKTVENYGLGWRLLNKDDINVVYHTGWWHGNCNIFTRIVQDTTTVIILSNRYNSNVFHTKNAALAFARDILGRPKGDMSDVAVDESGRESEGGGKE